MSGDGPEERPLTERVDERPSLDVGEALGADRKGMAVRFVAGALTSIASGGVTLALGPRVGGILLAFPAILVASLTLIQKEEDTAEAREDARGAIAGGVALTVFAIVFTVVVDHVSGALALVVAAASWAVVALGLYRALWWR